MSSVGFAGLWRSYVLPVAAGIQEPPMRLRATRVRGCPSLDGRALAALPAARHARRCQA